MTNDPIVWAEGLKMKVLTKVNDSRWVMLLACLAAAVMMFVSEVSYRQSIKTLNQLESKLVLCSCLPESGPCTPSGPCSGAISAERLAISTTLMIHRIGMATLIAISLLAYFMYARKNLEIKNREQAFRQLVQSERERLEIEVAQRTAQLSELTRHLLTAREDERHRLARNLHDDLGALLTSAKLDAARIKSRIGDRAPQALELLAHLVETLNSGIALGRQIVEDLRPSALSNLGLVATLEILAREFTEHSGIAVECSLEPVVLDATAELTVYRLVQEAMTNIIKYAKSRHVWVFLGHRDGQVEVCVRDDGIGFDARVMPCSGYGLAGMRFRVEAEGGSLHLVSAPGQGTLIQARLAQSRPDVDPDLPHAQG